MVARGAPTDLELTRPQPNERRQPGPATALQHVATPMHFATSYMALIT